MRIGQLGHRVGLLDADIYGPSVPLMTGIDEAPRMTPERKLIPFERYGLRKKRILEIGCGKGEFLEQICEMGDNQGVDVAFLRDANHVFTLRANQHSLADTSRQSTTFWY